MPEELEQEIVDELKEIQEGIEEDNNLPSETDGTSETCPLCKHPGRDLLTQVFYENGRSIDAARQYFTNKFKRGYSDKTWEKHFHDHVEPFIQGHELVKKKKLDDLMERTAEAKKDQKVSPVSMIKQMLFDCMLDAYVAKPTELMTKQEKADFSAAAKNISLLAKTYKDYQQMEMEILAYGKSEEEQKQVMKNYMTNMIKDVLKLFADDPEAQEKIADVFGIANVGDEESVVGVEFE